MVKHSVPEDIKLIISKLGSEWSEQDRDAFLNFICCPCEEVSWSDEIRTYVALKTRLDQNESFAAFHDHLISMFYGDDPKIRKYDPSKGALKGLLKKDALNKGWNILRKKRRDERLSDSKVPRKDAEPPPGSMEQGLDDFVRQVDQTDAGAGDDDDASNRNTAIPSKSESGRWIAYVELGPEMDDLKECMEGLAPKYKEMVNLVMHLDFKPFDDLHELEISQPDPKQELRSSIPDGPLIEWDPDFEEIARKLDISRGNARTRASRTKQALRKCLRDKGISFDKSYTTSPRPSPKSTGSKR